MIDMAKHLLAALNTCAQHNTDLCADIERLRAVVAEQDEQIAALQAKVHLCAAYDRLEKERDHYRDSYHADHAKLVEALEREKVVRHDLTELLDSTAKDTADLNAAVRFVESEAGLDCHKYTAFLSNGPCGACPSCRARKFLSTRGSRP